MDLNLDENVLWILGILVLVFFLFPQKNTDKAPDNHEKFEEEKNDYIYRRNPKERKKLVY